MRKGGIGNEVKMKVRIRRVNMGNGDANMRLWRTNVLWRPDHENRLCLRER